MKCAQPLLSPLVAIVLLFMLFGPSAAFWPPALSPSAPILQKHYLGSTAGADGDTDIDETTRLFLDIAIATPVEIPLGRLSFHLTPSSHPHYLPLHISNLVGLASGKRRAIDPKATYEGCLFQYSPAAIDDGSFRYRWGHICEGYGRNAIQTAKPDGGVTSWDEPFADPQRLKEASHNVFGGVYYGRNYDEIVDILANEGQETVVLLTMPVGGPGAGTSKFSIVRVGESPREWGERLLHNSAVVGYLDCGADGSFGGYGSAGEEEDEPSPTALDVLRFMARQRMGPPKIVSCGVTSGD
ncbi:hypothetical protein ACHAXT_013097 [Thalassiosira profunda]